MKQQFKKSAMVFAALAVLAAPLTLDQVFSHSHAIYRTIASETTDPYPHLTKVQNNQVNQNVVINITINDPEVIKKLNDEIAAQKKKFEELTVELNKAKGDLTASQESDAAKAVRIAELEKQLEDQVLRVTELENKIKELEAAAQVSKEELDKTKLAFEEAKKAADDASKALEEANLKVAEAQEALRKKEEELKKKEEELAAKTEEAKKKEEELAARTAELEKSKKDHDLYVCQSEERFDVLGKQIEELNKQQQQFTQVMLGLNQMMIAMFQQQQQNQNVLGMNNMNGGGGYFGHAYQNPMGQMQSPTQNVVMGSFPFNPWMQSQPQVINNYYGPGMGMGLGGYGQQGLPYGQQMTMPYYQQPASPGFHNFGMPGMGMPGMDDSGRAMFGGLQSGMGLQMPMMM